MFRARNTFLVLFTLLLALPARAESPFASWYRQRVEQQNDTTAMRREDKAVIPAARAKRFLSALEAQLGPLKLRDVPPAGKVFVTSTRYLDSGKTLPGLLGLRTIPEGSISPKIRIRKYLTRDSRGKTEASPITAGVSLLEVKMPHPTRPGVSLKPRLFVNDKHLALLMRAKRFADARTRGAVVSALKADRRNDPEVVDRVVSLLGQLHRRFRGKRLRTRVQIEYQRSAYTIALPGGGDVQVTVDKKVRYRHPKNGKKLTRMKRSWRAIEIKIPDDYARMTDQQLRQRGLHAVATVRQLQRRMIAPHQVDRLLLGRGKSNAFSRLAPKKARRLKRRFRARWRAAARR